MDFFLIIVGIVVFLFVFKNRKQGDDSHLTETQKRWRGQRDSYQSSEQNKNTEMGEYILRYKRPFRILEWLLTPVDPRLGFSYILNISMILTIFVGGPLVFGLPIHSYFMLISVLFIDFLSYNKQLLCEVTIWNPEFREKFME